MIWTIAIHDAVHDAKRNLGAETYQFFADDWSSDDESAVCKHCIDAAEIPAHPLSNLFLVSRDVKVEVSHLLEKHYGPDLGVTIFWCSYMTDDDLQAFLARRRVPCKHTIIDYSSGA
jgi:hypothetical protein